MELEDEMFAAYAARELLIPLWASENSTPDFPNKRPLLAHYTSMQTIEGILRGNELWFSSPYYMNDYEEVTFCIENAASVVRNDPVLANSFKSHADRLQFLSAYNISHQRFVADHAAETYIFCLSEHEQHDFNGLLSMWRGYGGNGTGAAIVFDAKKLNLNHMSPFIIGRIDYAPNDERVAKIKRIVHFVSHIVGCLRLSPPVIRWLGRYLFERMKVFSLFSKNIGFSEEREWRVVFMPERDAGRKFEACHSYNIGGKGIEPKFKFKVEHVPGVTEADISITKIVDRILLGPNLASPMALLAAKRMVVALRHEGLKDVISSSSIPYR